MGALKSFLFCKIATVGLSSAPLLDISPGSSNGNTILLITRQGVQPDAWEIWRQINGGGFSLVASIPGSQTSWIDAGILAGMDEWDYQVRAAKNGKVFAFSIPAGVVNLRIDNPGGAPGSFIDSFPNVLVAYGSFGIQAGNTAIGQFNAPRLHDGLIGCNFTLATLPNLKGVNFNSLQHTTGPAGGGDIDFSGGTTSLQAASFPSLISIIGDLSTAGATSLKTVSCPNFITCGLFVDLSGCTSLNSISFPVLTTIGNELNFFGDTVLPAASFPSLTRIGSRGGGNNNLAGYSCPALSSVSFPLLQSIDGFVDFSGDTSLTNLAFPALTHLDVALSCGPTGGAGTSASNLKSVSIPQLLFPSTTSVIDFQGCALDVTSVNLILRRAALSLPGLNACTITLQGGTNAAPTGQGVIDKAALIAGGNTVTTN